MGLAVICIGLAGALPSVSAAPPAAGPILGARAVVVGAPTVGASLLWMRSISAVADHTRTPTAPPAHASAERVAESLKIAVQLDPRFDQAWTDGALVLRVLESGDGPLTQAHRRALSLRRPDLAASWVPAR